MEDREMLEKAAKAAGYQPQGMEDGQMFLLGIQDGWNPLSDDGDALTLSIKLHMVLDFSMDGFAEVRFWARGDGAPCRSIVSTTDWRRAVVMAACAMFNAQSHNDRGNK